MSTERKRARHTHIYSSIKRHCGESLEMTGWVDRYSWATPWSAEEMLDGHHQRVDIPAHARTTHNGLLQKRLEENLC